MKIKRSAFLATLLLTLSAFTLPGCQNPNEVTSVSPPLPGMSLTLTGDVCPSIEVASGDTVTWTNQAGEQRQISAQMPDLTQLFDSGVLNQGDSFSFTFPEAGTYFYTCWIEQDTSATITVLP